MSRNILWFSLGLIIFYLNLQLACNQDNSDEANPSQIRLVFRDVTSESGFNYEHGFLSAEPTQPETISGGVAAGDYDGDGWVDLYIVRGTRGPNLLFRNLRDGRFAEVGAAVGLDITSSVGSGPAFADYDGDGDLDLFVGGLLHTKPSLFQNDGMGRFEEVTQSSGIEVKSRHTFSAAFGDYDLDGDLDLLMSHWLSGVVVPAASSEHLWRNNGDDTFTDVSIESGITGAYMIENDYTFTPNFADINSDGFPDILMAADFSTSKVFLNNQDGTFTDVTTPVISDENGMGAATGDYDNDGDLDWFVSSIFDPDGEAEGNWGMTGNRLYSNNGDGSFIDVTETSGVRHGFWGWGSCFADFNNDGYLDIFHVNGYGLNLDEDAFEFFEDPSRLFMSNGDGTFTEMAAELGLVDTGQGRGVVCFDYDRDGDIDIFVANNGQSPRLYRNDGGNSRNFLAVRLNGPAPNTEAIGARVFVHAPVQTQLREISSGSNYVSQNPAEAHFGVGDTDLIERLEVRWPDGKITTMEDISTNKLIVVEHPSL